MKKTRITSILIALMMAIAIVCTLGLSVSAAGTDVASVTLADGVTTTNYTDLAEAFTAAKAAEGSTLTLLTDISTDTHINVESGKFTVDLNGKIWESSSWALYVIGTADVKITDTATGGTLRGNNSGRPTVVLYGTAKLEIAGGTVEHTADSYAIDLSDNGHATSSELTVSGGKITTTAYCSIYMQAISVTVTGGAVEQFISYKTGVLDFSSYTGTEEISIYIDSNASVDTDNFKLSADYAFYDEYGTAVTVPEAGRDYTLKELPKVASVTLADGVTTTHYTDFAEAFAAAIAAEGSTLTLLTDISTDTHINVESGKFTVDLNGKIWESTSSLYVKGTADVKITDTATGGTLRGNSSGRPTVRLYDTAKLEIAGGTVEHTEGSHAIDLSNSGNDTSSELTVSGGKITTTAYCSIYTQGISVTVTGGAVEQFISYKTGVLDFSSYTGTEEFAIYIDFNASVDTDNFKLPADYAFHDEYGTAVTVPEAGRDYTLKELPKVASVTLADGVTTTHYTDLAEAFTAAIAAEGSTLTLLTDVWFDTEITIASGKFTVDLNGYDLDLSNGADVVLTLDGSADVTLINTKQGDSDSYAYFNSPVVVGENAVFSVKNVHIYTYEFGELRYLGGKLDLTGMLGYSFVLLKNMTAGDVTPGSDTVVLNDTFKAYIYDDEADSFTVASKLSPETEYVISHFVKITFAPNGGEGTAVTKEYPTGIWSAEATHGFTAPEGLVFRGWSTEADGKYSTLEIDIYEDTTYYAVWGAPVVVGGVELKDGEYLNEKGEVSAKKPLIGGYAYYKDGVLTLHNYKYEGRGYSQKEDYYSLIFVTDGTVIQLEGKNVLKSDAMNDSSAYYEDINAIRCYGDVTIRGEGSLEASGVHDAIDVYDLTVESGTLRLNAVDNSLEVDSFTAKGGTFELVAFEDEGIQANNEILIEGGMFKITSYNDSLYAVERITIKGGTFDLYSVNVDGIEADEVLIEGGTFKITSYDDSLYAYERITIKGGTFDLYSADDDGIDANEVLIEGGTFKIDADDEGIDGGTLTVSGGTFDITAETDGFDLSDSITVTGGSFTMYVGSSGLEADNIKISGGKFLLITDDASVDAAESLVISGKNTAIYYTEDFSCTTLNITADDFSDPGAVYALEGKDVKHTWSETYEYDSTAHWHTCSNEACLHTDVFYASIPGSGYALHDGEECSVCGYAEEAERYIGIYIGEFGLADGEYLTCDGKITTKAPVSGGYAYYTSGSLYLYNFVYEGNYPDDTLIWYEGHLEIEVEGENVLTNSGKDGAAIAINYGYLYIYGYDKNDVLTLNADTGIYAHESDINIDDVTLNINATSYGIVHSGDDAYYIDVYIGAVVNIVSRNVGIESYMYNELYIGGTLNVDAVFHGIYGNAYVEVYGNAQIDVSGGRLAISLEDFYVDDSFTVVGGEFAYGDYYDEYYDEYFSTFYDGDSYATRIRILSISTLIGSVEESIGKLDQLVEEGGSLDEITDVMDVLNGELSALTNANGEGRLDVIEKAVASLEAAVKTVNEKLSEVDTNKESISSLNTTVATMQETLKTLGTAAEDERLAGLIEALDTSLDTLSATLDGAEEKLAALEEKTAALEKDVEALNKLIAEGGTIEEIHTAIAGINTKLSALTNEEGSGKVDAVEKAVEALEAAVETINTKLSEIDTNKEGISSLNTAVTTMRETLKTLGTAAEDERLAGLIEALDTSLDTLSASLKAAEDKITALETALGTANGKLSDLETALGTANGKLSDLETALGTANGKVSALEGEIDALEGSLDEANAKNKTTQTVVVIVAIVAVLGNAGAITAVIVLGRKRKQIGG